MLVCPECGHDTFTQTRTTRTRFTIQFPAEGQDMELSSELEDAGERDEQIECGDCGEVYAGDAPELVTEEQYAGVHCEGCGLHEDDGHMPGCAEDPDA